MQIPIDIKALIDEMTDIEGARTTPLSISMYIDATAPTDVINRVTGAFASASPHTRVTISYVPENKEKVAAFSGDDMAVIVAGLSEEVGRVAAEIREVGVPVMVATTLPTLVKEIAAATGFDIAKEDICSPLPAPSKFALLIEANSEDEEAKPSVVFDAEARKAAAKARQYEAFEGSIPEEPILLTEEAALALERRMGEWVVEACREKRLAFALAFPFVRRPLSVDAVRATSLQNAGVGLVAFIPGADLPIMTLNQAKMILQIAAAYGETLGLERAKELACVVGGAFACRSLARQIVGVVPALGWAVKATIGYTGTYAMGQAAIEYFEAEGPSEGLVSVLASVREKVVAGAAHAQKSIQTGEAKSKAQTVKQGVQAVAKQAVPFAQKAAQTGAEVLGENVGTVAAAAARSAAESFVSKLRTH